MKKMIRRPSVAQRLRDSLSQVHDALEGGKQLTVRTVTIREPAQWTAARVKKVRANLHLSQAPFAKLLGVSRVLVEHWEQSVTTPRGPARRLLDEIERDPTGYVQRYVMHQTSTAL